MSTARVPRTSALALLACSLGTSHCARGVERGDERAGPERAGPERAGPERGVSRAQTRAPEYELLPGSRVRLELGSREGPLVGHVELARGRLWVDPAALGRARAQLSFDMTTTHIGDGLAGPGREHDVGALTEQSLDWLEIRRPEALAAHPEHRYAHFNLLQLRAATGDDARAGQVAVASRAGATARRVSLAATGELELHGARLPYGASLLATFEWDNPALSGPARSIELRTVKPITIDGLGHDIVPRDSRGDISSQALAELRRTPRAVRVSLHWTAELAHTGAAHHPGGMTESPLEREE